MVGCVSPLTLTSGRLDMDRRRTLVAGALTAAAVLGLGGVQLLPSTAPAAHAAGLVAYGSCDEMLTHYRAELAATVTAWGFGVGGWPVAAVRDSAATADSEGNSGDAVGSGPTGTNLQEQGVDEPDLAKLADGRLVILTGDRLRVLSAAPEPVVLGSVQVGDGRSYGGELLLDGDRALVVVPSYRDDGVQPTVTVDGTADVDTRLFRPGTPTTGLVLVDLTDEQPRVLEQSVLDGQYVSARLVGGTVRLVTTSRPSLPMTYPMRPGEAPQSRALAVNRATVADLALDDVLPRVERRGADGRVLERGPAVSCQETSYARRAAGAATLLVTTLRPGDDLAATDRTAVTTDGDLVYAAADRLYVATSRWGTTAVGGPAVDLAVRGGGRGTAGDAGSAAADEVSTELHAFDTTGSTSTGYVGTGTVPGYVMGRWALSRHEGDLRVATTRQPPWDGDRAGDTSSMVVRLAEDDGRLVETGRVEGLGRTEQIRAVRYFGDIAAVVTFRQTDPLYLLELSGRPRVLGELKVPGFSTYLHPVGDDLLLGLGEDADADGRITGMQVSLFDVSDLSAPRLVDRLRLGPGWSPAMDDSRAFTFDPGRRQATFAFASYGDPSGRHRDEALAVTVDGDRLRLTGRMDLAPGSWSTRVLTDGDLVFAVGDAGVVAGDAATMTPTGSVRLG
jgi:hypothetical protein